MRKVITFGTFDVLHIGHINILKGQKNGDYLIVGVSSDYLNFSKNRGILFIRKLSVLK